MTFGKKVYFKTNTVLEEILKKKKKKKKEKKKRGKKERILLVLHEKCVFIYLFLFFCECERPRQKCPSKKRFGYLLGHLSFWVCGMESPLIFFMQK